VPVDNLDTTCSV